LLIATITAGVTARRRAAAAEESAPATTGVLVAATLCGVMVLAYVVAIWAMTAKPV
jgi:hypothetical protein